MKHHNRIAAAILLAGMGTTALAGCGGDESSKPDPTAATQAARTQLTEFKSAWQRCDGRNEAATCADLHRINADPARPEACRSGATGSGVTITDAAVRRCADALRTAPTAAPAPTQRQASSNDGGIGSALVGFIQLLFGAACVLGFPALIVWGAIAGRRRARAVHREGAEWQQPQGPQQPAPMFDARRDYDGYDEPRDTPNNPWA